MSLRFLVFGNSGSGKSTLAAHLASQHGIAHLDLDSVAWEPGLPPRRRPLADACADIQRVVDAESNWVIEGCYADLLGFAAARATRVIWLDLPVEACVANARLRPWEPHKYPTKAAQDAWLDTLLDWIRAYDSRDDEFSAQAHGRLYASFVGEKSVYRRNPVLEGAGLPEAGDS